MYYYFMKNGIPSHNNLYIFNGDFVDRGKNSMEVLMTLFVSFLTCPDYVHLNRGNHEDSMMNLRYGFTKEILHKYKIYGAQILKTLEEVYTWLPIGTIIDNEILVVHGGISESTDLNLLQRIDRHKMSSVLIPPVEIRDQATKSKENKTGESATTPERSKANASSSDHLSKHEWEQVVDILWSDPRTKNGCYPNTCRGGGCYFGPDITAKILSKHCLKLLIRSHECKPEGYDICHNGKVVTIFSASNYYKEDSNRGAYIRLYAGTVPQFYQFQTTSETCLKPLCERMNILEINAIRVLKERIISQKTDLTHAFQLQDHGKSGKLSQGQWALCMESVLGLQLPWRTLRPHLVNTDNDGNVDYLSSFQDVHIKKPVQEVQSTVIETLYKYRSNLEFLFNIIDSDQSGLISIEEFCETWKIFSSHYGVPSDDAQIEELVKKMDFNKDGSIDFNEFLKAFYVVHKHDTLKPDEDLAEDKGELPSGSS
ncbi:PREDICTED: serine/threonine-protein phosphatase with EF-hands 1 [Propithecus coquereli]|uniref:serine/threonine-protein phosphatase with EF-hands 1 n=1 Tax=Propithecus coquereli TaxID=379532 RepID=UPI00063FB92B|nr:PREDICTED: serine/threonine-protein phosphatase with EF-hands 1 [Propithecus coquereli]